MSHLLVLSEFKYSKSWVGFLRYRNFFIVNAACFTRVWLGLDHFMDLQIDWTDSLKQNPPFTHLAIDPWKLSISLSTCPICSPQPYVNFGGICDFADIAFCFSLRRCDTGLSSFTIFSTNPFCWLMLVS